jgi:Mn-dependent DtxR family transcriptional regulator
VGIGHMDIVEKVYNFMKSSNDKNGFVPTVSQIAEELNIADHEANAAIEQLKESGRIKITDIQRKTTIEFVN